MSSHSLVLVLRDGQLLLARKRRGFGAGRLVAPGGKVEPGETAVEAAVRELREETGLLTGPETLEPAGSIRFSFDASAQVMDVALFRTAGVTGEPVETDELGAPAWYDVNALPLDRMWLDNPHWLPDVLGGRTVDLQIDYDEAAERILGVRWTPRP